MKLSVFFTTVLMTLFLLSADFGNVQAQGNLTVPRVSPAAKVVQTIGISHVKVKYHRPAVNEREVWGKLVPYENVWRAGANDNTVIWFSDAMKVEGQDIAAGTYGLHMIPTEDKWTVIFSSNSASWGSFSYSEDEDVLRVEVTPTEGPHTEWLQYSFKDLGHNGATLALNWEKMEVPVRIEAATDEIVMDNITNELRSTQGFAWQGYQQAANYSLNNDIDLDQGLKWIDNALNNFGQQPNFAMLSTKSKILEKMEKGEEAAKAMEEAMEVATNMELYQYAASFIPKDNEKAFEAFKMCAKKYPGTWVSNAGLAAGNRVTGNTKEALKYYKIAVEEAPDQWKAGLQQRIDSLEK